MSSNSTVNRELGAAGALPNTNGTQAASKLPLLSFRSSKGVVVEAADKKPKKIKPEENAVPAEPPDGGWGWFIVLAGFVATSFVVGLARAFGILYVEILQTFPESSAFAAAWIPGLYNTLSTGLAPVAGALSNRFSCRVVVFFGGLLMSTGLMLNYFATNVEFFYITLGIITGCGAGMCTTPGVVMVARYFKKKRALANGLYLSGTSVGAFILPLLVEFLSNKYGFRGALLIIGGLTLNVSALALVYRPPDPHPPPKSDKPEKPSWFETNPYAKRVSECCRRVLESLPCGKSAENKDQTDGKAVDEAENVKLMNEKNLAEQKAKEELEKKPELPKPPPPTGFRRYLDFMLFKNRAFLLFVFSSGFATVGYPHASVFMPAFANTKLGITKQNTGFLLSIMAATDLVGRIGFGYISDKKLFQRIHGYQFNIAMAATATLLLPMMKSYTALIVNSAFYGLGVGSFFVLKPVLLADHHGADKVSSSYGLMRLFHGMSSLITPPIAGLLRDSTGEFTAGFLFMGSVMMLGSLILFAMPQALKYEKEVERKKIEAYHQKLLAEEGGESHC